MHQAQGTGDDAGYAMAALLVAMALMAVMMSVAMPVWRQAAQREKEAELIWRGQQYDRAIQLFRRKAGAPGAPSLDLLIQQKFLRKKYKDPITGDDFELKPVSLIGPGTQTPVPGGRNTPGVGMRSSSPFGSQTAGRGNQAGNQSGGNQGSGGTQEPQSPGGTGRSGSPFQPSSTGSQPGMGGQRAPGQLIGGVRSKSKARSIKELNGRTRYDQWEFVYVPYNPNPQPAGVGGNAPGQQPRTPGQPRPGSSRAPGTGSQRPGVAAPSPQ
jgi:type II secretory pathway pseudopilin PulG